MSEAGAPGLTLAKYRQQGSLANAILKSTPLSGKAHEIFDDEPSASEGVPARGSKTTKPSAGNTGPSHWKEIGMVTTFISLSGSLAQANFVWNGDIVLNVAMAGGGVDWLGLLGLAIIIGVVWVIAARKR